MTGDATPVPRAELTVRFWLSDAAPWRWGHRVVWSARSPIYHVDAVVRVDGEEAVRVYEVALVSMNPSPPGYPTGGEVWRHVARRGDVSAGALAKESADAPVLQYRCTTNVGAQPGGAIAALQRHLGDEATEFPRRLSQLPLLGTLLPGMMRVYWCLPSLTSDAKPPMSSVSYVGVALAAADSTPNLWPLDAPGSTYPRGRAMLDWTHGQLHAVVRDSSDFELVGCAEPSPPGGGSRE